MLVSPSYGYELVTHSRITEYAYQRSILSNSTILRDLGITVNSDPFGSRYYEFAGVRQKERTAHPFEESNWRMRDPAEALTVKGWLMRGTIREDDIISPFGDTPLDGDFVRVLNHFFDPLNNRRLTVGVPLGLHSAPSWAMGSADIFTQPNTPEAGRRNHFSIFDAREAMYRALTGRNSLGQIRADKKDERDKYWATTFRALGDVLHLNQDMAQPQHTRNDAHPPLGGHTSVYEEYTEARATGGKFYKLNGSTVPLAPLDFGQYSPYPIPAFTKYGDFWSTSPGGGSLTGNGLADYSSRGFFGVGTNFNNKYPLPSNNPADFTAMDLSLTSSPRVKTKVFFGNVTDTLNPALSNGGVALSAESVWDRFLGLALPGGGYSTYHLIKANYDDMASLLIPRAVAYSAGLINYFFRGKIEFVPDTVNPEKYVIKNLSNEDMRGTFTLYFDDVNDVRQQVVGAEWTLSIPKNSQSSPVSFTRPVNPVPKEDGHYILVFRGDMGNEKASAETVGAVTAVTIRDPGFLVVLNWPPTNSGRPPLHRSWDGGYQFEPLPLNDQFLGDLVYYPDTGTMVPYSHPLGRPIYLGGGRAVALDTQSSGEPKLYKYANGLWDSGTLTSGISHYTTGDPVYLGNDTFIVRGYYPAEPGTVPGCPIPGARCDYYWPALYRSTDGGISWNFLSQPSRYEISRLAYLGKNKLVNGQLVSDPNGGDTLLGNVYYVVAGGYDHQFLRSVDGGVTWNRVGFPVEMIFSDPQNWQLMDFAYAGKGIVYALFYYLDGFSSEAHYALFKTRDAGDNWYKVGPLPFLGPDDQAFRLIFAGDNGAVPGRYP